MRTPAHGNAPRPSRWSRSEQTERSLSREAPTGLAPFRGACPASQTFRHAGQAFQVLLHNFEGVGKGSPHHAFPHALAPSRLHGSHRSYCRDVLLAVILSTFEKGMRQGRKSFLDRHGHVARLGVHAFHGSIGRPKGRKRRVGGQGKGPDQLLPQLRPVPWQLGDLDTIHEAGNVFWRQKRHAIWLCAWGHQARQELVGRDSSGECHLRKNLLKLAPYPLNFSADAEAPRGTWPNAAPCGAPGSCWQGGLGGLGSLAGVRRLGEVLWRPSQLREEVSREAQVKIVDGALEHDPIRSCGFTFRQLAPAYCSLRSPTALCSLTGVLLTATHTFAPNSPTTSRSQSAIA
eukprot:scaffold10_cov257-Pinguiococcus_pyrenoidosus.AAC.10